MMRPMNPSAISQPDLVPIPEACRRLGGISRSTLWRMLVRGDLTGVTVSRRRTMVLATSITSYITSRSSELAEPEVEQ